MCQETRHFTTGGGLGQKAMTQPAQAHTQKKLFVVPGGGGHSITLVRGQELDGIDFKYQLPLGAIFSD